ncbi:MAG: hypothetical protein HS128_20485 [Ideonella sp.]|nr:hypothetical protein [Ideonella sp.]MCC7458931.1 hypothetical protein [Nitrospira sp.]
MLIALIFVAAASLPAAALFAVYCYVRHRRAAAPAQCVHLLVFIVKVLLVGLAAYMVGGALGIGALCWSRSAGNLCGLPGAVVVAPLCASLGIAVAAWRLTARAG